VSYDIYLEIDAGGPDKVEAYWSNYTSNVAPMWRKAMPDTDGLAGLHDWKAQDAIPVLERGGMFFDLNEGYLKALNPENGWGDYEGARQEVQEFLNACRKYPKASIFISR